MVFKFFSFIIVGGNWRKQNERQKEYETNKKNVFQLNTFVYLDVKPKTFSKSFADQVILLFYIFTNWRQNFGGTK